MKEDATHEPVPHQAGIIAEVQIPIRTWVEWDDALPGFVELNLLGFDGCHAADQSCLTLTATDISTGWTVNRSVRSKTAEWVFAALELEHVISVFPFPINGSEFINDHLLR